MRSAPSDAYVTSCAAGFSARVVEERERAARRADALRARAREAARRMVEDHGAARVWLFGSLAWGEPHLRSDVDLFVEGLDGGALSAAYRAAEDAVGAPVDLVRAEEASPGLAERVRAEGVLLVAR